MSSSKKKQENQKTEEQIKEELREELKEEASKGEGLFGDVIKKVISVGVGAAFMTEDTVRSFLHDVPIPREMVNGLLQNARKSKEDFLTAVQEEVRRYLSKVDPTRLVDEITDNYDLEINATIRFRRKNQKKSDSTSTEETQTQNASQEDNDEF